MIEFMTILGGALFFLFVIGLLVFLANEYPAIVAVPTLLFLVTCVAMFLVKLVTS